MTPTIVVAHESGTVHARRPRTRRSRLLLAALPLVTVLGCWLAWDSLVEVPWQAVPFLILLSALHYACAAVAIEAASGHRLRFTESLLAQTAAAAAARIIPAGLGGMAVNVRYLTRCDVPAPQAFTAVGLLKLVGGGVHALLFLAVVATEHRAGTELAGRLDPGRFGAYLPHVGVAAGILAVLAIVGAVRCATAPGCRTARYSLAAVRAAAASWRALLAVARDPRALAKLVLAAAGTPVVLGCAFAVSLIAVPDGAPVSAVGVLLLAYLTGSALGAGVPVPAGMGTTEAALTAAAIAVGVPAIPALQGVLLFRVTTFWLPVPAGVLAARRLRRTGRL
ncbi:lysylphosphatidylglycerol synthase transmembrane domain-containing protein [Actinocorallia longicatena]|uniref:Lysylphosphatidylglycerol synthase-like protein n=1 Tax=Actinocorallia longicatena TaxID=111803 RepID=A0ABP6Q0Z7_9ACTN